METKQMKIDFIKTQLLAGKSQAAIARERNVTRATISDFIKRHIKNWRELKPTKTYHSRMKLTDLEVAQHLRFVRKRTNARKNGFDWTLDIQDIKWPTHCPILGMELDYLAIQRQENSPSFDRINNIKGYIKGNVHIISWRANRIKNDGTAKEHRQIADYLDLLIPSMRLTVK